jgi:hypothetical protein
MAIGFIEQFSASVTSTASAIINKSVFGNHITIYNNGSNNVYLGNSSVTATTGVPVAPGASFEIDMISGDTVTIYAICAASQTSTVIVATML